MVSTLQAFLEHWERTDKFKAWERLGLPAKRAWRSYADTHLGCICDPAVHDALVLMVFLIEFMALPEDDFLLLCYDSDVEADADASFRQDLEVTGLRESGWSRAESGRATAALPALKSKARKKAAKRTLG